MIASEEYTDSKIEEVKEILESYAVMEMDVETIITVIEDLGEKLAGAYKFGRQAEAFIRDELGQTGYEKFVRCILHREEPGEHLAEEC